MEKDTEITEVIFRKYCDGQVFALFPYIPEFRYGTCMDYMHIGQHGTAHLGIIQNTKLATESEYLDLFNELENQVGYKLRILKKMNWRKYSNEYHKPKAKK